jgi:hypothetical protein
MMCLCALLLLSNLHICLHVCCPYFVSSDSCQGLDRQLLHWPIDLNPLDLTGDAHCLHIEVVAEAVDRLVAVVDGWTERIVVAGLVTVAVVEYECIECDGAGVRTVAVDTGIERIDWKCLQLHCTMLHCQALHWMRTMRENHSSGDRYC